MALALSLFGFAEPTHKAWAPMRVGDGEGTGDVVLYRRVVDHVRAGENYYDAVAQLHREMMYPLKPFVTVRLPTLAWFHAHLGLMTMMVLVVALIATVPVVWYFVLKRQGFGFGWRATMIGMLAVGGALGLDTRTPYIHDIWAGLLLSIAIALDRRKLFAVQLALVVLATLIRELAFPFLLVMLAHALVIRARGQVAAIVGAMGFVAIVLFLHKLAVDAVVLPGDYASGGWSSMRGPMGFARDMSFLAGYDKLPLPLVILISLAPFGGWLAYGLRDDFRAFTWFSGFALTISIFARADNFYWAQLMFPAYLLGWPILIRELWIGFRRPAARAPAPA